MSNDGPVFLCGGDRSGIGLVGEMLEMHPAFALTRRTNFFAYYADRFVGLSSMAEVEARVQEMLLDRRFKPFEDDVEAALAELSLNQLTPTGLFEALQRSRAERLGRRRWGDKSLWSEQYADVILEAYPTAVMVHIVRDPRDQFASFKFHRRDGDVATGVGAAMLRRSIALAERNTAVHGDRYLVLRYEDLVADPTRTLSVLCEFLGEEFSTSMLDEPTDDADAPATRREVHSASVGRYRHDLTPMDIATIERLVGHRMARFGYPTASDLRGIRRLAFVGVRIPIVVLQASAWRVRSGLKRLRGRRPSSNRLSVDG